MTSKPSGLIAIGTSVRADVWRNFDGSIHLPGHVNPRLQAANYDADARVCSEAAETLGKYMNDPTVLQTLRHLAQHDPDRSVRPKAARTVGDR